MDVAVDLNGKGQAMKKRPGKAYHHGDLRSGLLSAAAALLEEKGIAALSLREVAKAAGVSHAAPYRHFRDKTALIEALAAEAFEQLAGGCERARRRHPDDPARQLVEAGLSYLFFSVERPAVVQLMFGGAPSLDSCGDELRAVADRAWESLVTLVRNGQAAGIYRDADTHDLTLVAWSTVYGLSLMVNSGLMPRPVKTRAGLKELGETVAGVLLSGMLVREEQR